jgi:predicted DNA-binding protein
MANAVTKNLHVPLPEPLYRRLRAEAERTGRPATEIARDAIDRWLAEQRRATVHEAILSYARANAGSAADLDPELEAAAVEHLQDSESRT